MHRGMAPGTAISAAHSSGTAPKPISLMAVAGKMLVTSRRGGEQHADDVVLGQVVALHEAQDQLLGPLRHLLHAVDIDSGGPAQAPDHERCRHGRSLYCRRVGGAGRGGWQRGWRGVRPGREEC